MEINDRILTDHKISTPRIVLGSFPTWSIAKSSSGLDSGEREKQRIKNGDFNFFFGSSVNKFWDWYRKYIDEKIIVDDISSIKNSLDEKSIFITDIIKSCERKGKSSLDRDLKARVYNYDFFNYPNEEEKLKLLCTSKGILDKMLMTKHFFKLHPKITLDQKLTNSLMDSIVDRFDFIPTKKPINIAKVLRLENGGVIECLSIPSPGSPYRNLEKFGLTNKDSKEFLHTYLNLSFKWFS
jgi:hypothetical protein